MKNRKAYVKKTEFGISFYSYNFYSYIRCVLFKIFGRLVALGVLADLKISFLNSNIFVTKMCWFVGARKDDEQTGFDIKSLKCLTHYGLVLF